MICHIFKVYYIVTFSKSTISNYYKETLKTHAFPLGQMLHQMTLGRSVGRRGRVKVVVMLGQLIENKPLPQWLASTQLSMLGDGG